MQIDAYRASEQAALPHDDGWHVQDSLPALARVEVRACLLFQPAAASA